MHCAELVSGIQRDQGESLNAGGLTQVAIPIIKPCIAIPHTQPVQYLHLL